MKITETDTVSSPGSVGESSATPVQVATYLFTGFKEPVTDGSVHELNKVLPIRIGVEDGRTGRKVRRELLDIGVMIYDADMNVVVDDVFRSQYVYRPRYWIGDYAYQWRTKGLTAGEYTIAAVMPDGIVRTIQVTLGDGS